MNRRLYLIFLCLVFFLLGTLGVILWRALNPEWKAYQRAYFREERERIAGALGRADEAKRAVLQKRLRSLRRPQYGIRQIILKGSGRVDRCITCHMDLKALGKKHPEIERYPFEEYGCTVCHGGVGRATEKARAHSSLRIPRRPLYEYLEARSAKSSPLDLFRYNASGERIPYVGSGLCLRCHLSSHPKHVARWRKIKFKPLEGVRKKLEEVRKSGKKLDESRCLACHTTGYDEKTGRYLEDQVTCESCHGPGGFYADLMAGGRARDGAELARTNILGTRADQVCLTCHKPDRHRDYEGQDGPPILIAGYLGGRPAPSLDGRAGEDAWYAGLETRVPTWQLDSGPPRPATDVFIRAVYNDSHIYFVFRWSDKTQQKGMGRWIDTGSGWRAVPEFPDALALHWRTSARVVDFAQGGCAILCHTTGRFKEFPRMATGQEGALVDEWYWNAFTAERSGRPGDGFLDDRIKVIPKGALKPPLRRAHPASSAAHGSDASGGRIPQTAGGVPLRLNVPLRTPPREGPLKNTLPLYETGRPEGGDSADIQGKASWSEGMWILELGRALKTPSKRDVQFDPTQKSFSFGLALWDGDTGDQHRVATLVRLRFEPPARTK